MKPTPNIKLHRKKLRAKKRFEETYHEHDELKKKRAVRQFNILHGLGKY